MVRIHKSSFEFQAAVHFFSVDKIRASPLLVQQINEDRAGLKATSLRDLASCNLGEWERRMKLKKSKPWRKG